MPVVYILVLSLDHLGQILQLLSSLYEDIDTEIVFWVGIMEVIVSLYICFLQFLWVTFFEVSIELDSI